MTITFLIRFYTKKISLWFCENFFLLIPMTLLFLICLTSVTIYFITKSGNSNLNFMFLSLTVSGAMVYLTSIIGQLKKHIVSFLFMGISLYEILLLLLFLFYFK